MGRRFKNILRSYSANPCVLWKNFQWRFPRKGSDLNHVFVVGCPRSGTTLLQVMLAQNSNLFCYQRESEFLSYRNIFDPRRIWFGLPEPVLQALYKNCKDIVDFFDTCVGLIKDANLGKRFVEKTPQHILHLSFIFKWFPNSQVIHIVRDGRDCYCSSKINRNIPQNASVDSFAKYWKKSVSRPIEHTQNQNLFTIKYEDLVSSPRIELAQVMEFLNLKLENEQLQPESLSQDIRARRIEFQRLASEINSASIGRWHNELTEQEVVKFEQIAHKQLRYYGYL